MLLCLAADVLLEQTAELEAAPPGLLAQAFTYRRFAALAAASGRTALPTQR